MNLIWATRGRSWGYRFLRSRASEDPLPIYDDAFSGIEDGLEVCRRLGNRVALRFPDPLGRTDTAGRVIPHEFVAFEALAEGVDSVEDGLRLIWPLVAEEFARVWEQPTPPSAGER